MKTKNDNMFESMFILCGIVIVACIFVIAIIMQDNVTKEEELIICKGELRISERNLHQCQQSLDIAISDDEYTSNNVMVVYDKNNCTFICKGEVIK